MMTYSSVNEIFDAIDGTRQRLYERVGNLRREQESLRPSSDCWSIGEIVEHLAIMEARLSKVLGMMLSKAEAENAADTAPGVGQPKMPPFSLEEMVRQSMNEKYQAPEAIRPTGVVPVPELLAWMRESRAALRLLQSRIEATDLARAVYPHPVFGPLNLYQWLAFIGLHEARHLRQIETLMASPEYERA